MPHRLVAGYQAGGIRCDIGSQAGEALFAGPSLQAYRVGALPAYVFGLRPTMRRVSLPAISSRDEVRQGFPSGDSAGPLHAAYMALHVG